MRGDALLAATAPLDGVRVEVVPARVVPELDHTSTRHKGGLELSSERASETRPKTATKSEIKKGIDSLEYN